MEAVGTFLRCTQPACPFHFPPGALPFLEPVGLPGFTALASRGQNAETIGVTDLEQYIVSLPKAEVHLHLEGTVDLETLGELATRHGMPLPDPGLYHYENFGGFLKAFKVVCDHLRTPADYELITYRMMRALNAAGVKYADVFIAAGVLLWQKKPLEELFVGIEAGYRHGRDEFGIEIKWIFDATRQFGPVAAMEMARRAAALRDRGVVGIGIGGDEQKAAPELFREVYDFARARGLQLTAHAGETAGPDSILGAIVSLGVQRIGHGITAIYDPKLVGYLAQKQIGVDICLSSNLRTGAVDSLEHHPLRTYFDAGVLVTLSTDDPAMFETGLVREYVLAHDVLGFTREELARLAENSLRASLAGAASAATAS